MIRRLIILLFIAALAAPGLSACGKKAPLDKPTPKAEKHKPEQ
jgi:predicted small lipoprotein YifL